MRQTQPGQAEGDLVKRSLRTRWCFSRFCCFLGQIKFRNRFVRGSLQVQKIPEGLQGKGIVLVQKNFGKARSLSQKQVEHADLTAEYRAITNRGLHPLIHPQARNRIRTNWCPMAKMARVGAWSPLLRTRRTWLGTLGHPTVVAGKRRCVIGALSPGDVVEREMDNLSAQDVLCLQRVLAQKNGRTPGVLRRHPSRPNTCE